jgi:transcriptional regulator with XRE-family HTH domain
MNKFNAAAGALLARRRQQLGLSQKALAARAKCSWHTVLNYESGGRARIDAATLADLERACDVDVGTFYLAAAQEAHRNGER